MFREPEPASSAAKPSSSSRVNTDSTVHARSTIRRHPSRRSINAASSTSSLRRLGSDGQQRRAGGASPPRALRPRLYTNYSHSENNNSNDNGRSSLRRVAAESDHWAALLAGDWAGAGLADDDGNPLSLEFAYQMGMEAGSDQEEQLRDFFQHTAPLTRQPARNGSSSNRSRPSASHAEGPQSPDYWLQEHRRLIRRDEQLRRQLRRGLARPTGSNGNNNNSSNSLDVTPSSTRVVIDAASGLGDRRRSPSPSDDDNNAHNGDGNNGEDEEEEEELPWEILPLTIRPDERIPSASSSFASTAAATSVSASASRRSRDRRTPGTSFSQGVSTRPNSSIGSSTNYNIINGNPIPSSAAVSLYPRQPRRRARAPRDATPAAPRLSFGTTNGYEFDEEGFTSLFVCDSGSSDNENENEGENNNDNGNSSNGNENDNSGGAGDGRPRAPGERYTSWSAWRRDGAALLNGILRDNPHLERQHQSQVDAFRREHEEFLQREQQQPRRREQQPQQQQGLPSLEIHPLPRLFPDRDLAAQHTQAQSRPTPPDSQSPTSASAADRDQRQRRASATPDSLPDLIMPLDTDASASGPSDPAGLLDFPSPPRSPATLMAMSEFQRLFDPRVSGQMDADMDLGTDRNGTVGAESDSENGGSGAGALARRERARAMALYGRQRARWLVQRQRERRGAGPNGGSSVNPGANNNSTGRRSFYTGTEWLVFPSPSASPPAIPTTTNNVANDNANENDNDPSATPVLTHPNPSTASGPDGPLPTTSPRAHDFRPTDHPRLRRRRRDRAGPAAAAAAAARDHYHLRQLHLPHGADPYPYPRVRGGSSSGARLSSPPLPALRREASFHRQRDGEGQGGQQGEGQGHGQQEGGLALLPVPRLFADRELDMQEVEARYARLEAQEEHLNHLLDRLCRGMSVPERLWSLAGVERRAG